MRAIDVHLEAERHWAALRTVAQTERLARRRAAPTSRWARLAAALAVRGRRDRTPGGRQSRPAGRSCTVLSGTGVS